jgi:hypothetical protein
MSYRVLGGGRKYCRVLYYNDNGILANTIDLKAKCEHDFKATRKEEEMENGDLATKTDGHRVNIKMEVYNVTQCDHELIPIFLNLCDRIDRHIGTMYIYPDYSDNYDSRSQNKYQVLPTGDKGYKYLHDFLESQQVFNFEFNGKKLITPTFYRVTV